MNKRLSDLLIAIKIHYVYEFSVGELTVRYKRRACVIKTTQVTEKKNIITIACFFLI